MRVFHINYLPQDKVYILLKGRFHNYFFNWLNSRYSFKELNKLMNNRLNYSTYKKWKNRVKRNKTNLYPQFIPLWFLVRISCITSRFRLSYIEKNIMAYKGPSSSKIILNPNFPLREDEKILRIIAHLIGDGHTGGAFATNLPKGKSGSYYANTNLSVINCFQKDLKSFGNFRTRIKLEINKKGNKIYKIIITNLIGYILSYIYKINFDCFSSRIPKSFYKLNNYQLSNFIKAFADDEAHVCDSSIEFYSANSDLIKGIMKLIEIKFPNLKISMLKINSNVKKNKKYSFSILSESLEFYAKNIGFDHEQKMNDLIFNLKRIELNKSHKLKGDIENKIIGSLNRKNLTAKQLSREHFLSHTWVLESLNKMQKEGKVEIINKDKFSYVWGVKT